MLSNLENSTPTGGMLPSICPSCGAADLIHETRDVSYIYKGEQTTISEVTGDFCPACGEVVLNREHGDRYSDLVGEFQRQVNAAIILKVGSTEPFASQSAISDLQEAASTLDTVLAANSVHIEGVIADFQDALKRKGA